MSSGVKTIRSSLFAALILVGSIAAISCSPEAGTNAPVENPVPSPAAGQQTPQPGGFRSDSMAKAAATLGVSQDKLEAAFTQARSELGVPTGVPQSGGNAGTPFAGRGGTPTPRGERGTPPSGGFQRPDGTPRTGMSSELMIKVAEILGVSQQDLENAFAQAQGAP
jgi:hypothetical protein